MTSPALEGMRISDADRHAVLDALGRHAGDGYLTTEELEERSASALSAKTRADLGGLLSDLPVLPGLDSPAILWAGAVPESVHASVSDEAQDAGRRVSKRWPRTRLGKLYRRCSELVTVGALLTGIWLMSGGGYYWPVWVLVPLGVFTVL